MRICFLAPTGYGKTTAVKFLEQEFGSENIRLAEPLYQLQTDFYQKIGVDISDKQDGELLQFFGKKVRQEQPDFLNQKFIESLAQSQNDFITNDDCRPDNFELLKKLGFKFVKIDGFSRSRDDHRPVNPKSELEWQTDIPSDYVIENRTTLEDYYSALSQLITEVSKNV